MPPGASTASAAPTGSSIASRIPQIEPTVTREQIQAKRSETEENEDLTKDTKQRLIEQYRSALANLDALQAFQSRAETYAAALDNAPDEARKLRQELEAQAPLPNPPVELPNAATESDIEQLLAREQAEAAALEAQLTELDKALSSQADQPAAIRQRLAEASQSMSELDAALQRPRPQDLTDQAETARIWALETERDALRAEVVMLDQQIVSADARRQLTEAQRDLSQAALERLRARRAYLENEADRLRRLEAERVRAETESAERELANADPLVQALAHRNREISDAITKVTEALDRLDEEQARLEEQLRDTRQQFDSARERISAAGLSPAVGRVLVDERVNLPDLDMLRDAAKQRADEIAALSLTQIRIRDRLRQLKDLGSAVDEALVGTDVTDTERLRTQVEEQLRRQRALLERAFRVQESYQRAIGDLDFTADQYATVVADYRDFLAEHLLWVPSTLPLTEQSLAPLKSAVWWLIAPQHWAAVGRSLGQILRNSPLVWLSIPAILGLLAIGPRLRQRIRRYDEPMRRVSTDRFIYSLSTLGLTLVLASAWPLLTALFGWELISASVASAFTSALGHALLAISLPLFYLRAFRLLCMPKGLADKHFRWSVGTLRKLRWTTDVTLWVLIPLGLIGEMLGYLDDPGFNGTLTRFVLMLLCVGLAVLTAIVLHPARGVFSRSLQAKPHGWLHRTRMLWYPALIAVPLLLALLSLAGYLFTSGILLRAVLAELWLGLVLVVAHQMIVRWLIVTRRGLALEAALERRAQREALRESIPQSGLPLDPADDKVDLASLDSQTRRLLNSSIVIVAAIGLWAIWSDVLPALNFFDNLTLWSYTTEIEGVDELVPVTLADIGLILVIGTAALVAIKNLPALLEILLLKNSEISTSGRYTLVTLTRYLITAIGIVLIAVTLGLRWSQVQWLVAALSVGIGFGLQEIVANFISGLIILFERPLRVGDIVTIGDTTGTVSKIQIRATTIRNWDRQELVVPNKEFITGRLLNWTLSDELNRVVIPVGVEYGSDTRKALALLHEVAAEHPKVLDDPAPLITFEGFGDNALNLVLRCYLETLEFRLAVTSELHQAIDDKFRSAGIGIAFPQRDIHLRSAQPIEIRLNRGATGAEPKGVPLGPSSDPDIEAPSAMQGTEDQP